MLLVLNLLLKVPEAGNFLQDQKLLEYPGNGALPTSKSLPMCLSLPTKLLLLNKLLNKILMLLYPCLELCGIFHPIQSSLLINSPIISS